MNECSPLSTALEENVKLCNDNYTKEVNGTLYRQLVGILNYLTTKDPIFHIQLAYLVNSWLNHMTITGK